MTNPSPHGLRPWSRGATWRIISAQITDTRFYIQAVSNKLEAEIKHAQHTGRKGDVLQPGVVITNEVIAKHGDQCYTSAAPSTPVKSAKTRGPGMPSCRAMSP